jgi:cupin superfamily acireductone dioxygenase involved in methionine salvage
MKFGYRLTFFAHVSKETTTFVLENLRLGLSIYQVMNKHKSQVKEIMENNKYLSKDLFICEQDICNLAGKLAKETYKKHENDAKNVRMQVSKNKDKVFFYQESKVEVKGTLQGCNMPFTIGI